MAVPQELVDGLGDESYKLREKAEQELAKWAKKNGEEGLDVLSELKKKAQSPEVQSRLDNVISGMRAIPWTRGYMGIILVSELGSAGVSRLVPNTPAAKSGLQPNDKIIEIDGIDLSNKNNRIDEAMTFVQRYVKTKKAGEKLTLKIDRNGKKLPITFKLEDYDKQMNGVPWLTLENEKERIERNLKTQLQLLEKPGLPDVAQRMFRRRVKKYQQRLEQINKEQELKRNEKKDLKK